jgi:hypothetical protein
MVEAVRVMRVPVTENGDKTRIHCGQFTLALTLLEKI